MTRRWRSWLMVVTPLAMIALGCEAGEPLALDLRTDMVAGREFAEVVVEVESADGVQTAVHPADPALDYLAGARVAELTSVRPGDVEVRIALRDESGEEVVGRVIRVTLMGPIVVTALVSRTCREVSCPGEGDAASQTTCLAGACVDPRCSELEPGACGEPGCVTDADCGAGPACTTGFCIEGQCALAPDDDQCGGGEVCEAGAGCIPEDLFGACDAATCELGPWAEPTGAADSSVRRRAGSASGGGLTRTRGTLQLVSAHGEGGEVRLAFRGTDDTVRIVRGTLDAPVALPPVSVEGSIFTSSLAVGWDAAGEPTVAAVMDDGVHVYRHAAGWTELPLIAAPNAVRAAAVAFVGGDPVVANGPEAGGLHVRRFDGAAWVELGAGAATGGGLAPGAVIGGLALADGPSDALAIAWTDRQSGTDRTYVLSWDGAAWVGLDQSASGTGIGAATGSATSPSLAFEVGGGLAIAWANRGAGGDVYAQRWNGTAWEALGAGSNGTGGLSQSSATSSGPQLRALASGELALAWRDSMGLGMTTHRALLYDGATWVDRSIPAALASRAGAHAVVGDASDDACVVFEARGNGYASCFDGSAWSEVGPSDPVASVDGTSDPSSRPAITASADGEVDVIWEEINRSFGNITYGYTRALVDGAWVERVAGVAQGEGIDVLDADRPFAFHDAGPVVGWRTGSTCLHMRRFDGTSYVDYAPGDPMGCGVVPDAGADTRWPVGIVGPDGEPWLAFQEHCTDWNVYVLRHSAAGWQFVGGANCVSRGASDLDSANRPAMAVDPMGRVVLAYEGRAPDDTTQVYVRRWDGSAWRGLGGSSTERGISDSDRAVHPALAIDALGRPFVAWEDGEVGASQIHARYFDGEAWVEAAGSATGGGISQSAGACDKPHMVADAHGRPIVIWSDDGTGVSEIYARRWTGLGWQELSGSATDGGISNSDAPSYEVDVAIAGDRLCLTWQEPDGAASHVLVRCLDVSGG